MNTKEFVMKLCLGLAIITPALLVITGLVFDDFIITRFVVFYLAPIASFFFLSTYYRLRENDMINRSGFYVDIIVLIVSLIRVYGIFPFSGHILFIVYLGLTTKSLFFRIISIILFLETSYFKLILWDDFNSWMWGIVFSVPAAFVYHYINETRIKTIKF